MVRLLFILSILSITSSLHAQFQKSPIFTEGDKIDILLIPSEGYYYVHNVKKGHTLYSLARAFDTKPQSIAKLNNIKISNSIEIGDQIKVPLKTETIYQGTSAPQGNNVYVPLYYTVKKQETLFRIAKMYFNQEVNDLKFRNDLVNNNLEIGQKLLIGWLPYGNEKIEVYKPKYNDTYVSESHRTEIIKETPPANNDLNNAKKVYDTLSEHITVEAFDTITKKENIKIPSAFPRDLLYTSAYSKTMRKQSDNTVAHWDKSIPDNGSAYALHDSARPNTYIRLYNPNTRRTIKAKVIGKIPFGTYTSDVKLVISPKAAKALGGLDQRFRVHIEYIQ